MSNTNLPQVTCFLMVHLEDYASLCADSIKIRGTIEGKGKKLHICIL
uniref:Uncharacterized protein n=1 Tax=Anguilla anguilla TaxID=7936 RepID=A0A0E9VMT2_ANGAN